jgi:hypothetical protein
MDPITNNLFTNENSQSPSPHNLPIQQPTYNTNPNHGHPSLPLHQTYNHPLHAKAISFIDNTQKELKSGPLQPIQLALTHTTIPNGFEPLFEDKLPPQHIKKAQPKENFLRPKISQQYQLFPGQQTLFQTITQEALDRPAREKLSQKLPKHKVPKSDTLQRLMAIAGDDWDVEIGIEKNLLDTGSAFICPGPEGHFPDPESCSVYYQCAQDTPHKRTCDTGLHWNMRTNQCDWEVNVNCTRNRIK